MAQHMALESLVQRGRSPLYNELVSLFQETQKGVSELRDPSVGEVDQCVRSTHFARRLSESIKKHTNLTINQVLLTGPAIPSAKMLLTIADPTATGTAKSNVPYGTIIERINTVYNDRTGKLSSEHSNNLPIRLTFSFNTGWWVIRNKEGALYFTPEEIAAVTLHELGHADDYIRTYARVRRSNQDAADLIDYLSTNVTPDVAVALIKELKKSPHLTKDWTSVLGVSEHYFAQDPDPADPAYVEALSTLTTMVTSDVSTYNLYLYTRGLGFDTNQVRTRLQLVDKERSADDYAARHGAVSALASANVKLETLDNKDSSLVYQHVKSPAMAVFFSSMRQFSNLFKVSAEDISNGYDPLLRRVSLMVETAKHAFHDNTLSTEVKDDLKAQIAEAEQYLREYQSSTHHRTRMAIKRWRDSVGKVGRILAAPFQNRLSQDYERLQNETRSLSRHSLHFLAKR